jgi:hypothetical protein
MRGNSINYLGLSSKIMAGEYVSDLNGDIWISAVKHILNNFSDYTFAPNSIHMFWIVNGGHIRRLVKNDYLLLSFLEKTLPKYSGSEMVLYRGECKFLYEQNLIGFCWTPKRDVAEMFARGLNAIESGGVLLKAKASPEAILSAPNDHSSKWLGESEFTCNPSKLCDMEVLKSYPKI